MELGKNMVYAKELSVSFRMQKKDRDLSKGKINHRRPFKLPKIL